MSKSQRARASAGLALAFLLVIAALAAVAPAAQAPRFSLDEADVNARWKQGWLARGAAVRFSGEIDAPASLIAVLKPLDRPAVVTARAEFDVADAGRFQGKVVLPPRALPGRYRLRLSGVSGDTRLAPAAILVTIPAPPEGVVDRALVGTSAKGPWLSYKGHTGPALDGLHDHLWVRFRFLYPPSGKRIELLWKLRWHTVIGRVCRRYENVIDTEVGADSVLPRGVWKVVLKIDGRVAKQMDVRLRDGPKEFRIGPNPPC